MEHLSKTASLYLRKVIQLHWSTWSYTVKLNGCHYSFFYGWSIWSSFCKRQRILARSQGLTQHYISFVATNGSFGLIESHFCLDYINLLTLEEGFRKTTARETPRMKRMAKIRLRPARQGRAALSSVMTNEHAYNKI